MLELSKQVKIYVSLSHSPGVNKGVWYLLSLLIGTWVRTTFRYMHFPFFPVNLQFRPRNAWPWFASAALLCLIATASLNDLPALRAKGVDAERKIAALEMMLRSPLSTTRVTKHSQNIASGLETPERLSAVARDLQALATQHGLALLDASYKPADDVANPEMGKVDVSVRLKGAYQPLKKTIAALLSEHRSLALTSLALRRGASTDAVLEIDLIFNFYYRKGT